MKRINLPLIADTLFIAVCTFVLTFTLVRYYTDSAFWGLFTGIPCTVLSGAVAFVYISKKQNQKYKTSGEEKEKRLLATHLALSSYEYVTVLFLKLLGQSAKTKGKTIYCDGRALFFIFKFEPVSMDDAAQLIKLNQEQKRVYCNCITEQASQLFKQLGVEYVEINGVYKLLKDADLLPESYIYDSEKKQKLFYGIKNRFNKRLCAPLFWSGLSLTALSYFTFYPLYYIISGGILLILSASALIFGKSKA